MAEQTVELAPSEAKMVSFEAIPHEVKTYQVSVDGLTGSFRAIECTPGDAECREADLYVCSSQGRWELAEANSPQCETPLGKILKEIEAGTWTATVDELDDITDWPTEDYQAAIDAAYTHAASEVAGDEVVWWSAERGYYTALPEGWDDAPPWEDYPPWEDWDDAPWYNWEEAPPWEDWDDAPWYNWDEAPY